LSVVGRDWEKGSKTSKQTVSWSKYPIIHARRVTRWIYGSCGGNIWENPSWESDSSYSHSRQSTFCKITSVSIRLNY
jgi:hypothetical protein